LVNIGAWVYYRLGDFKRVRSLLLGVADRLDKLPIARYYLGMACLKLGTGRRQKNTSAWPLRARIAIPVASWLKRS